MDGVAVSRICAEVEGVVEEVHEVDVRTFRAAFDFTQELRMCFGENPCLILKVEASEAVGQVVVVGHVHVGIIPPHPFGVKDSMVLQ